MAEDPTEEMIRKEVERARKIIQSDNHAAGLKGLTERFDRHYPDNSKGDDEDVPKPPKAVPPKEEPVKRGIWWGEEK